MSCHDPEERLSDHELDRRWKLVRRVMDQEGIDFLVCGGGQPGGYSRWLSNRSAPGSLVVFPSEGDLLFVTHGDDIDTKPVDSYGIKGVTSPSQPNLSVNTYATVILGIIKEKHPQKIGFLGLGFLNASTYVTLLNAFPSVHFVDVTDLVVPIKAVKSEEELVFIRRAMDLHDSTIEVIKSTTRPGKTLDEVILKVKQYALEAKSEFQLITGGSAPPGTPCNYSRPSSRVLKEGDQIAMLIECSAKGGYFGEMSPIACIGKVPRELQRVFDDALETQNLLIKLAMPEADPMEMFTALNEFLVERGYPPEGRLAGHCQGYDLVERPALTPLGEKVRLQKGMMMSIHPTCHSKEAWGFPPSQNYLLTEFGPKKMQKTAQEIIII